MEVHQFAHGGACSGTMNEEDPNQWISLAGDEEQSQNAQRTSRSPDGANVLVAILCVALVATVNGIVYTLSVFIAPVREDSSFSKSVIPHTTSVLVVCIAAFGTLIGPYLDNPQWGPVRLGLATSGFFFAGFALASLAVSTSQEWLFVLSLGGIMGIAAGTTYLSIVRFILKTLPKAPGVASSLVAGFIGLGSILCTVLLVRLTESQSVQTSLLAFGTIAGVLSIAGFAGMWFNAADSAPASAPTPQADAIVERLSKTDILQTPYFWCFFFPYLFALSSGWGLVSVYFELLGVVFPEDSRQDTRNLVLVTLVTYTLGRIMWGVLSDKLGLPLSYTIMTGSLCFCFAVLPAAVDGGSKGGAMLLFCMIYVMFGGAKALFGASAKQMFGKHNAGTSISLFMTAFGGAGIVGPLLITNTERESSVEGRFNDYFVIVAVLNAVGCAVMALTQTRWNWWPSGAL